MSKKESKPQLIKLIQLLQEFVFKVKDQKGREDQVIGHLPHLHSNKEKLGEIDIDETFPDELLMTLTGGMEPWYAD